MAKKSTLIKKSFEQWYPDELQKEFGLKRDYNSADLAEWTASRAEIPPKYREIVQDLRKDLIDFQTYWNESELLAKFIAPLLSFVHFEGASFSSFSERILTTTIGAYQLTGKVDWMAAGGSRLPQKPYFFIHEYKRLQMGAADPLGQLLAEMLAAQTLNADDKPVYGCFVVGNFWTFVYLDGLSFATSEGFDATTEKELNAIWSILTETKRLISLRVSL